MTRHLIVAVITVAALAGCGADRATTPPSTTATSVADTTAAPATVTAPTTSTATMATQTSGPPVGSIPEGMPGDNVSEPSTVTALDVAGGRQRWQTRPPMVYPTPMREDGATLILHGGVSPSNCLFSGALTTLDVGTGTFVDGHIVYAQSLQEAIPPVSDGALSIRYVLDSSTPESSTGLEAVDSTTGSTVWSIVQPGPNGPVLVNPPLMGSGVIVAAVGGRNPTYLGPAPAIDFIDERSGAILWSSPGDPAVTVGGGMAYVLSGGRLEAHDIRTGASRWRQDTDATQVSANDDVVVVSGATGTVAYDTSGHRLWDVSLGVQTGHEGGSGLLVGRDSVYVVTSPGDYRTACSG